MGISAVAQVPYTVRHYTIKDGLAQGGAYYMIKDSRRYLWFMSQNGLTRFDGTHFVNYYSSQTDPGSGPTGETGNGLAEAPTGDLWFGTEKCLNHYVRATDRFIPVFAVGKKGKAVLTPTYVFDADSARIWYINEAEGLCSLDPKTGKRTVHSDAIRYNSSYDNEYIKHQPGRKEVWSLLPDNGVMSFNYQTRKTRTFFSRQPDNRAGTPRQFSALYPDPDGTIWLAYTDVLIAFDPVSEQIKTYPTPHKPGADVVAAIEPDGRGNLLLATGADGVYRFSKAKRTWTGVLQHDPYDPNSLATNAISELLVDQEGVTWINTDPVGLDKLTPDIYGVRHYDTHPLKTSSLNTHSVSSVIEDRQGHIWISMYMGGIDVLDPKTERIIRHYGSTGQPGSLPSQSIYCLYIDRAGTIWTGTGSGLCRYNERTDSFVRVQLSWSDSERDNNQIRAMTEAGNGKYFATTASGLYQFDRASKRMTLLANPTIWFTKAMYFDPHTGYLYAGRRRRDLICYEVRGDSLRERYRALSTLNVLDVTPDANPGRLWVSTNNGLYLLRASNGTVLRSWHEKDGLPHRVVYSALPDKNGNRWISTDRGMAVLNPTTGAVRCVRSIEPTEFNNIAYLSARSGEFYFGSATGLYRFDPLIQTPRYHALEVNLTGLFINDQAARTDSSLTEIHQLSLTPDQRTLTLQFSVIDYFSNGQNHYRYRLKGYDRDWVESGPVNTARYANLPPGQFMFEVLAADAEGRWMQQPRQLSIRVSPPFWRTAWFIGLFLLVVGGVTYVGIRTYLRGRLRRQHREFQLQTASQLAERERLSRDLHDNIGPDVVVLKLQLEAAHEAVKKTPVAATLERIITQAEHIVVDLRQLSHALMPVELQQRGLSDTLELFIQQVNHRSGGPEISFTHALDTQLSERLQQGLLQVAKELINNALKHAHATLIDVELYQTNRQIHLVVSDNGQGYNPNAQPNRLAGIGLRNIRTVVKKQNGQLNVVKKSSGGMRHQVAIPVG